MKPKILILVLHSENEPWASIGLKQKETWMTRMPKGVTALHYIGGCSSTFVKDGTLYLPCEDSRLERLMPKTLLAFKYALENFDFDYIFRTNTSSYVDAHLLQDFLSNKPRTNYYGGPLIDYFNGRRYRYARGSGVTLSKDMVKFIVNNTHNTEDWDDIIMGDVLFENLGVQPIQHVETQIQNHKQLLDWMKAGSKKHFHYRCKGEDRPTWECVIFGILHDLHK